MTFRVDAELQAAFVLACKAADVTAAQVLRAAMRQFLASNSQAVLPLSNVESPRKRSGAISKGSDNG